MRQIDMQIIEQNNQYSLLGYDLAAGKLDMMMRFKPGGGSCEPHMVARWESR
jgi:hypothetical protein